MSQAFDLIHRDLCHVMEVHVEKVLRHYGIEHWLPSIVLVNPENRSGEWVLLSNDDPHQLAATIVQEPARVDVARSSTPVGERLRVRAKDVYCPRCGADAGEDCVSLRGGSVVTPCRRPHSDRAKRAAAINREGGKK